MLEYQSPKTTAKLILETNLIYKNYAITTWLPNCKLLVVMAMKVYWTNLLCSFSVKGFLILHKFNLF
jgi:hypothetical protein